MTGSQTAPSAIPQFVANLLQLARHFQVMIMYTSAKGDHDQKKSRRYTYVFIQI